MRNKKTTYRGGLRFFGRPRGTRRNAIPTSAASRRTASLTASGVTNRARRAARIIALGDLGERVAGHPDRASQSNAARVDPSDALKIRATGNVLADLRDPRHEGLLGLGEVVPVGNRDVGAGKLKATGSASDQSGVFVCK